MKTVETKDQISSEFAARRLELVNKSILACSEYLGNIKRGRERGNSFDQLIQHLKELRGLFVEQPHVRGIENYLGFHECRELLSLLKKLPPSEYEELDELVGLPGDGRFDQVRIVLIAFKDAIVFGWARKN